MRFCYEKFELQRVKEAQEHSFLLCNGLGGYSSLSAVFSAPRTDQGILISSLRAPGQRINLVHRLKERLVIGGEEADLSTQQFADGTVPETGYRWLSRFSWEYGPVWMYRVGGVRVQRSCAMVCRENTVAVLYRIENLTDVPCTLEITPFFKFAPKESALRVQKVISLNDDCVSCEDHCVYIRTDGELESIPLLWQMLAYPEDAKDGREAKGLTGTCCRIRCLVPANSYKELELVFSAMAQCRSGKQIIREQKIRMEQLLTDSSLEDPVARQLILGADSYLCHRESTGGMTVLAGYPLFSDWGRDTMIAFPGCALATRRFEDARSILSTFLAYERDGLLPNLFPERGEEPLYNTVDAALLFIDCVWQYAAMVGDWDFARKAWPVLCRIIAAYQRGTHHNIHMDEDGLISAGAGMDQVTWMDVCIDGILPTPRHGKPVEINAYWYNALRTMDDLGRILGYDTKEYSNLAEQVKESFRNKFYMPQKGYLKDLLSGTEADDQIRCNQIWALSQRYPILDPEEEERVLLTVTEHLLTPCGLRTLSPEDPSYRGTYKGSQFDRDMAYHQGTVWVYPLGAYCRSYLRIRGNTGEAARAVRKILHNVPNMLRQGCVGQLPEIYDGTEPREGKGCFAQAWSVGELLRVYREIQQIEESEAQGCI